MIADGLSQLGRSADGTLQVYLNLFLAVLQFFSCQQYYPGNYNLQAFSEFGGGVSHVSI